MNFLFHRSFIAAIISSLLFILNVWAKHEFNVTDLRWIPKKLFILVELFLRRNKLKIGRKLKSIIMKCLQRDRRKRFQSAFELNLELSKVHDNLEIAKNKSPRWWRNTKLTVKVALPSIVIAFLILTIILIIRIDKFNFEILNSGFKDMLAEQNQYKVLEYTEFDFTGPHIYRKFNNISGELPQLVRLVQQPNCPMKLNFAINSVTDSKKNHKATQPSNPDNIVINYELENVSNKIVRSFVIGLFEGDFSENINTSIGENAVNFSAFIQSNKTVVRTIKGNIGAWTKINPPERSSCQMLWK